MSASRNYSLDQNSQDMLDDDSQAESSDVEGDARSSNVLSSITTPAMSTAPSTTGVQEVTLQTPTGVTTVTSEMYNQVVAASHGLDPDKSYLTYRNGNVQLLTYYQAVEAKRTGQVCFPI